ncbi:conserved hypothetical protein, partial [Trichinella spiralis]|uniref:hypothetical protein n=1 Tax=Trichinella spiralis TaxID=6334 RepID=UPI0001EFE7FF
MSAVFSRSNVNHAHASSSDAQLAQNDRQIEGEESGWFAAVRDGRCRRWRRERWLRGRLHGRFGRVGIFVDRQREQFVRGRRLPAAFVLANSSDVHRTDPFSPPRSRIDQHRGSVVVHGGIDQRFGKFGRQQQSNARTGTRSDGSECLLSFACIIQKIYACGILIPPSQLYNRCGILGDDYCLIFKLFTIVVLHLSKVTAISIGQFFRNAPLVETIACLSNREIANYGSSEQLCKQAAQKLE